jgi:type 1 fimbria pilin
MKKFFAGLCLVLFFGGVANADFGFLTFKSYSSAAAVGTSCTIWGGTAGTHYSGVTSTFNPIPAACKVVNLGTKGMKNYSASKYKTSVGINQIEVYCYQTASPNTAANVQLGFNNNITEFFPVSNRIFYYK